MCAEASLEAGLWKCIQLFAEQSLFLRSVPVINGAMQRPRPLVRFACLLLGLLAFSLVCNATETLRASPAKAPVSVELWPEGVPGLHADAGPSKVEGIRTSGIHFPTMVRFDPEPGTANGTSVIFCPGGGYVRVTVAEDGGQPIKHLVARGVTVFVLKYRLNDYGHPAPLQDVLRAIRTVRSKSPEWGLDPSRIVVSGASAGGHLALCAATLWDDPAGKTGAALDEVSARPDFVAAIYPVVTLCEAHVHKGSRKALLGENPDQALCEALSIERRVRPDMPRVFLVATMADRSVPVENSLVLYKALRDAKVPSEMHVYGEGSHGNSLDPQYGPTALWMERLTEWMAHQDLLGPNKGYRVVSGE